MSKRFIKSDSCYVCNRKIQKRFTFYRDHSCIKVYSYCSKKCKVEDASLPY